METNLLARLFGRDNKAQEAELAALRQAVAELKPDAERYRHMREHSWGQYKYPIAVSQHPGGRGVAYRPLGGADLDAAIDAARAA